MSDPSPEVPPTWSEYHESVVKMAAREAQQLSDYSKHPALDQNTRILANHTSVILYLLQMTLIHVGWLERYVAEIRGEFQAARDSLSNLVGAEIEVWKQFDERVEQLEYRNVAEAQMERLKELLAGDIADLLAGKLRGEDAS